MLKDIENEVAYTRQFIGKDKLAPSVMEVMASVPRHRFVPPSQKFQAYANGPLCIGHGQTISQPYIVALMTDMLDINRDSTVLEIGTGSGYQTAVLSALVNQVYTMEIIPELSRAAQQKLDDLGYRNVEYSIGDGHEGWPEHAPYDGIIVTAAAQSTPHALIEQLKPNANLVIPVGSMYGPQELLRIRKDEAGNIETQNILAVAFVPLVKIHTQSTRYH